VERWDDLRMIDEGGTERLILCPMEMADAEQIQADVN
jgi:hypothetical protein